MRHNNGRAAGSKPHNTCVVGDLSEDAGPSRPRRDVGIEPADQLPTKSKCTMMRNKSGVVTVSVIQGGDSADAAVNPCSRQCNKCVMRL